MQSVSLNAHFDGGQIVLDEPYDFPANVSLVVTVLCAALPEADQRDSEQDWLAAVAKSDAFAFLADDAEDIYSMADGEFNPLAVAHPPQSTHPPW